MFKVQNFPHMKSNITHYIGIEGVENNYTINKKQYHVAN